MSATLAGDAHDKIFPVYSILIFLAEAVDRKDVFGHDAQEGLGKILTYAADQIYDGATLLDDHISQLNTQTESRKRDSQYPQFAPDEGKSANVA